MKDISRRIVLFLERISLQCWESSFYRFILFSVATIFAINFLGYHFGTFDQSIHIPFLKKFADPTLYPNDHFLDLRFTHYSYFWFLFVPFYRLGILEITMFITYVCIIYLTFLAVWNISKTLFNNPLVSFLSVIVFMLPHIGFGLTPLIEFSLLNRTFVLPFLLFSINEYLNKRYLKAYILLGILYNLHILSVNFVLVMFIFDSLIHIRIIGIKKLLIYVFGFCIAAFPVLYWKSTTSKIDLSLQPEWLNIINNGFLHHLFSLFSKDPVFILPTISGLATLILFFIGFFNSKKTYTDHTVKHFMFAAICILIVELVTARWLPITIIIQLQIVRIGIFILLFGYLYFTHYLVTYFLKDKEEKYEHFFFLTFITIISGSAIIPLITLLIQQRFSSILLLRFLMFVAIMGFFGFMTLVWTLEIWFPGIYIFPRKDSYYEAQKWARNNTLKDSIFIVPPYPWLFFDYDWRVVSERSTIADLGDLGEIAINPQYLSFWLPRFKALAPGALLQFKGNVFENKKIIKKAFYTLQKNDFKHIAEKYGASYLVVEKPYVYDFQEVFENNGYRVYKITK